MALRQDLLEGVDSSAVLAWMDNYCRAHPLETIVVGATALRRELEGKRGQ